MIIALRCFCIYFETNLALFAFLSVFYYIDHSFLQVSSVLMIKYKIISHFTESIDIVIRLLKSMLLFFVRWLHKKFSYNMKLICT